MLAVAVNDILALYEGQPLLTQVGGFLPPGSGDEDSDDGGEELDDAAAG